MDWGLLQPDSKNPLLRNELVFYRWTYYVAAPLNIILRFGWTLNAAGLGYKGELIGFVTALLEAYRRIQWNFFRLENEVSSLIERTTNQHNQLNIIAYQQLW